MTSPDTTRWNGSLRIVSSCLVGMLLAVTWPPGPGAFFGHCSEQESEAFVQGLPQVLAMEDDLATECSKKCSCYHASARPVPTSLVDYVLHVDCSQRNLADFPGDIPPQAYSLDMSGNKIINVTFLPKLNNLRELNLADNWIRHIDNTWIFEHSPKLRVLRLSENRLSSIKHGSFSGLSHLEELDLSMNMLKSLETHALNGLVSLKVLRLDRNQLYDLSRDWFMSLTSLIELHASRNHISRLESHVLDRLNRLQHLDLSQNALRDIHQQALVGMDNLKLLNLSSNPLLQELPSKVLAESVLPRLDILLTDKTSIQRLPPYAASNLSATEMSLSYMPHLRVVEKFAFYNCTRLHTLQIHDNPQLIFIHPLSFSSLPSLQRLLIHNNGLIAIPGQIVTSLPSLKDLQLHHNPLHCDCNSYWLREELSKHQKYYHRQKFGTYDNVHNLTTTINNQNMSTSSKPLVTITTTTTSSSSSLPTSGSDRITSSAHPDQTPVSITQPYIREPDRVACFFPNTQQGQTPSAPMVQLAIQYFSRTCQPSVLSLFHPVVNTILGETLQLECQGLGVPYPQISWLLPDGREINSSTLVSAKENPSRVELTDDTLLTIKDIHMSDGGMYGCTATNSLGQDMNSVMVHVKNKPLDLIEAQVGYDYITVGLVGNIPRAELGQFQIYYRKSNSDNSLSSSEGSIKDTPFDARAGYGVLRLRPHGTFYTATISHLKPHTTYNVCLVFKDTHRVSCKSWTTLHMLRVVHSPKGIVRVSKTQVVVAILGSLTAVVLLLVVVALVKRRGKSSGYHDSLGNQDEKASIPLDGMLSNTHNPSLNSSRTALLSNSHV